MTSKSKQAEENSKDNNNNNGQPTEKKHPVEAPISHSSWIHRLTTQKTNDAHSEEIKEEKKTVATKEECSSTEEQESPAEKDNENETQLEQDSANKDPKKELQKGGDGSSIWSWFGYSNVSNNSATSLSKDDEPVEEESIKLQSELDSAEQQASKKPSSIHDDTIEKEQDPDTASADQHHHPKQSYWKSLFISSMSDDPKHSQKDSVIISDDSDEQSIQEEPKQHTKSFKSRKNVVLPTFESQFTAPATESQPGFFNRALSAINSMFTSKTHDQDLFWKENDHLLSMVESMKKNPQNVANKRIVIVGVHGWFPMKLVRNVVGEPTGTSAKFCEQMTAAVKTYFSNTHELELPGEAIVSIPLQYEGKVLDRVERLYDMLTNEYKESIASADVILWTTHSQGTPVSTILLRRLIEDEIIHIKRQPICMLAMAGISHGPFPSLKGNILVKYFEADAARELFDFMDSDSPISIQYREAMAFILQNNIKTVLVGSMQDQVVPLYSAIMSGVTHPNILRAIYIDGHIYSKDDFLIRLILFSLKLRNIGLSDHGVLIHISEVLAGNLYSWEGGHSTIYEEVQVFMLPLSYLFESKPYGKLEPLKPTSLFTQFAKNQQENNNTNPIDEKTTQEQTQVEDKARKRLLNTVKAKLDPFQARSKWNPFYLPWAMRGIWDDPNILNDSMLSRELEKLQDLFDRWNPSSTKLKEIKFRLEPIRARL